MSNTNGSNKQVGKSKRYQAVLQVDSKAISALIGRGGANTKRVCREAGNGTFIRAYNKSKGKNVRARISECDAFHIEAYSSESVKKAAASLRKDEQAFLKHGATSRPQHMVKCVGNDIAAVGTVIGSRGANIQNIQRFVGGGCYIVHKKEMGGFLVTCDTRSGVAMAVSKIRDSISNYHLEQKEWKRRQKFSRDSGTNQDDTYSNNSFGHFVDDSDDEDSGDNIVDRASQVKQRYQKRISDLDQKRFTNNMDGALRKAYLHGGIHDRKTHEKKRWDVRKELGKKTNAETGGPFYEPYEWYTKQGKLVRCAGTSAVPWADVDHEMKRRQQAEDTELEKARGLGEQARQNKLLAEMDSTSEESFPGLPTTKKSSRAKVKDAAKSSKVLMQSPALLDAIGDLASEQSNQRQSAWDNGVSARCLKVDDVEAELVHHKQTMKSNMVTLGKNVDKSAQKDLGGAASQEVDLTFLNPAPKRNVTLTILPTKMSWADMADSDDESEDDMFA